MDRRVRVIPIPIVLMPIGAIKPPTPFNNLFADFIKEEAQDAGKELLKQLISAGRKRKR